MRFRSFLLATIFVFLASSFSPALCQESPESKVNRLLAQIYSLPNFPKLSPLKIRIDKNENKKWGHAYYLRRPKRFLGLKTSNIPEIHLSEKYIRSNTDDAVLVTLVHEMGHHFDLWLELYFEPNSSFERLIKRYEKAEKGQYFAEAFALYVLGEELYKKGRSDSNLTFMKNGSGAYWLYIETNPLLHKYYTDQAELWISYWFEGAKSRLDKVTEWIGQADK